jgi:hypothetical protein
MEVSGQLHAPAALSQGRGPRYPLDKTLSVAGVQAEEKEISCPPSPESIS